MGRAHSIMQQHCMMPGEWKHGWINDCRETVLVPPEVGHLPPRLASLKPLLSILWKTSYLPFASTPPCGTSLVAQTVKRLFTMWETSVRSLGWEDSLEKEMATHSSTLALKIPWTEELGAGYYPWGHKESGMTEQLHFLSPCGKNSASWPLVCDWLWSVNVN